jgi:small-conductance mechanosensitive channel
MWRQVLWPGLTFVVTAAVALATRAVLLSALRRWGPGCASDLVRTFRLPSVLWALVLALYVAVDTAELPHRLGVQVAVVLRAAIILSVTITAAGLIGSLIVRAGERRALAGVVTSWVQTSARLVVLLVGGLVFVSALGIEIAPILTALGVGGLAVALALQDTLANLFAGMHLLADRPIRVGDYVKLAEGVEGYVLDVGWRSTRIRMLQNSVVILPNQKVAQSIITNYDLPEPRIGMQVRIAVEATADPDRVEAVLVDEVARAVGQVPGLMADPSPSVAFIPGFGESSLVFSVNCQAATFIDQFPVQHELRKRFLRRLRAEGLPLALPAQAVYLHGAGVGDADGQPARSAQARPLADHRQ